MCFISPTQPHTGGETRRHFPVQFSLLNVICCCLLFNLCITIYRMYNVAELILWLESWFLEVFALWDFFFFQLDLMSTFEFSFISCRSTTTEWFECMLQCPPWDQQELILFLSPPNCCCSWQNWLNEPLAVFSSFVSSLICRVARVSFAPLAGSRLNVMPLLMLLTLVRSWC